MTGTPPGEGDLPELPFPVLFNGWKHHAGFPRQQITLAAAGADAGLDDLAAQLVVVGTALMDLYTGPLTPGEIADGVVTALAADNRLSLHVYRSWVHAHGGYQVVTFPEDGSRWVLRLGDEAGRYVHVHPGRWSLATLRVRANVLKTAVMALAYATAHGSDPLDVRLVNTVREGNVGRALIPALGGVGRLELAVAVLLAAGLLLA